ncbi:MAG: YraN family protein [Gammaproteobacteria bacterium]|nr:YraN family protein [Gammaproteobacteria bacterium]
MINPRERGARAETRALGFLSRQGLVLVERNFRCREGEIDLIMFARETLVFVEVRWRSHPDFGSAAESVTTKKQLRIMRAARHFLQLHKQWRNHACRFDVIAMDGCNQAALEWIKDAFRIDH